MPTVYVVYLYTSLPASAIAPGTIVEDVLVIFLIATTKYLIEDPREGFI